MKVVYEFEDNDLAQREVFEKAHDFYMALSDINDILRPWRKGDEVDYEKILEEISDKVFDSGIMNIP